MKQGKERARYGIYNKNKTTLVGVAGQSYGQPYVLLVWKLDFSFPPPPPTRK